MLYNGIFKNSFCIKTYHRGIGHHKVKHGMLLRAALAVLVLGASVAAHAPSGSSRCAAAFLPSLPMPGMDRHGSHAAAALSRARSLLNRKRVWCICKLFCRQYFSLSFFSGQVVLIFISTMLPSCRETRTEPISRARAALANLGAPRTPHGHERTCKRVRGRREGGGARRAARAVRGVQCTSGRRASYRTLDLQVDALAHG